MQHWNVSYLIDKIKAAELAYIHFCV